MGNYLEKVGNVLVSVDKMSTSLSKLKRNVKMASGPDGGSLTDDQKIRLQLSLDLSEFREAASKRCGVKDRMLDWESLEELEEKAKSGGDATVTAHNATNDVAS